jgi:replicative DNA helicase
MAGRLAAPGGAAMMHDPAPQPRTVASVEAEQALLGAIFLNNDVLRTVSTFLTSEHFSEPVHQRIFDVCASLIDDGDKATPVSVRTFLPDMIADDLSSASYLAMLAANGAPPVVAESYARRLVDLALRRQLIDAGQAMIDRASAPDAKVSAQEILETHQGGLFALTGGYQGESQSVAADAAIDQLIKRLQAKLDGHAEPVPTTGYRSLDYRLGGGLQPGRLIVVGGRPGSGKTVLMVAMARRCAKAGNGVAAFSLEIDQIETSARLVASHYGTDVAPFKYADVMSGRVSAEDLARIEDARRQFQSWPMEIDCTAGLSVGQIEARTRFIADKMRRRGNKLSVVFVDYLQLIETESRGNRTGEIGAVVLALKNMAKRLGVAVVLLSQLSRAVEARDDKRPMTSDLRDSGNIEEHADAVALLYRPSFYDERISRLLAKGVHVKVEDGFEAAAFSRRHDLEVIFDKNRMGPPGTDTLYCDVARSLVAEGAPHRAEDETNDLWGM